MASQQGAGGSPGGSSLLAVEPQGGLALLEAQLRGGEPKASRHITFDAIALGPGVYVDAADRRIRITEAHLPLVADRLHGVFLRDLHREDLGASVGVVAAARAQAGEVRFTGAGSGNDPRWPRPSGPVPRGSARGGACKAAVGKPL